MTGLRRQTRLKTFPPTEKSLPLDLGLSNDSLDVEQSSCNVPGTPEAESSSWYEFFMPNSVQDFVQRRLKRFETFKFMLQLMAAKAREDRDTMQAVLFELTSTLEVLKIPALNEERHGQAQINKLRSYIFDSLADTRFQLVDITQADFKGSTFSSRLICQGKQIRPVFPQFPLNEYIKCGLDISFTVNDVWQLKAAAWNFVPLQPLLDIVSMQELMDAPTSEGEGSTPHHSPPSSPDSNADLHLEDDVSKNFIALKKLDHQRGVCVPCSFYVFRSDGCRHGDTCKYCHLCSPQDAKRRRRQLRKEVNKQKAVNIK